MASDNKLEERKKIPAAFDISELPDPEEIVIKDATYVQPERKKPRQLTVEDLRDPKTGNFYKPKTTLFDVGFGVAGDIYKKAMGEEVDTSDYNIIETGVAGIIDGNLKILKNGFTLTGAIIDAFGSTGTDAEKGTLAKLEKYFDESIVGKIQRGAEEAAYQDAVGRLSSAFVQLYAAGRAGGAVAVGLATKAKSIANNYIKAAKLNKVTKPNKNFIKAMNKANELNKLSGKQKFIAIGVGGGVASGLVVDAEDIGTLGDIDALNELIGFDFPTRLDRVKRDDAKDEAVRNLVNRFKFGADTGLISVVAGYGISKIAQKFIKQGDQLAYSNDKLDQWLDKFGAQLRPRSFKSQELFEGTQKVQGKINAGQVTSKDLILDIDKTILNVAKNSGISKGSPQYKRIIGRIDEVLFSGQDTVKNGKIIFNGFDDKTIKEFRKFGKELNINAADQNAIVRDLIKIRNEFNVFKNSILTSKNLNVGAKEFNQIMSERIRNLFTSEYRIASDRSIWPWVNYKPSADNVNAVKALFDRYGRSQGVKLSDSELDLLVDDVIKNVRMDEVTKTPTFFLTKLSALDDTATQIVNIADNIKGGKFVPTTLVKTADDLRTLNRFFGQKRDFKTSIINVIHDLAALAAKDNFYTEMAKLAREQIKQGKRAIVYPTRLQAIKNLPNQQIITNKNGLQIKSPLGEAAYTNPLNGYFTSKPFADALQFAEKLPFEALAKNVFYKHFILIPKGATQISKTILGPFTHTRNFVGSSVFALASGNLVKNPFTMVKNFKQAWNTIQPQLLYRNLPKDQALYKWLLEEQVVNSSATARDIAGMIDDVGKGGDIYMRFFGKFGEAMKRIYTAAGDVYVAEDDLWKIFNFLGEVDSYTNAYKQAVKNGVIKTMPNNLQIWKEAANLVRNYMPNYGYVGRAVQAVRRLPLGNFVAWPAEIIRNTFNMMEIAVKEINNPVLRDLGYKRLATAATTMAVIVPTVAAYYRALYGISKKAAAAVREFVPYYSKDSILFIKRDEEGNLEYIDGSGAFVYDSMLNPIQAIVASVDQNIALDSRAPLVPGLYEGIARAASRFARPFIEPSIWYATMLDILVRNGETKDGFRIWNPDEPLGDKIQKAMYYTVKQTAPLSYAQFSRLGTAIKGEPGPRGEEFKVDDEIAGFYGFRNVPVNVLKQMPFKIYDYTQSVSNSRNIFTSIVKGGDISRDDIIERFFVANQQKFKAMQKHREIIELAKVLETDEDELKKIYLNRGILKDYTKMENGEYIPFKLSKKFKQTVQEKRETLEEKFDLDKLEYDAPLDQETLNIINTMRDDMNNLSLFDRWEDQIRLDDYVTGEKYSPRSDLPTPPLPPQPQPNPEVVKSQPNMNYQGGLTMTENALLSDAEKAIRLRQRGMV